ncbi:MAG: hypothetical protein A2918_03120 [Candidatus Yanofskybacteria bacterium RIFCSPLOWO2_01_FULL_42_49]|uniref:Uncharacterized protein n=1 Tax=Candidatus Yanofskybacteria bacterium RIFCSPLOWO2_01_FULL_42_49 TaxID=1802694 RepID=A0A1F8G9T4_9BACT|nr:MAG: hypothetical protein A2918_03120 [Candidatus Yanofskybacteria bacterium RIFCSPLOWO2_01_FULL_42_49]
MLKIGFIFPSSDYLFDPFRGDPFTHFHILTILEDAFGSAIDLKLIDLRGIKRYFAKYHIPECNVFLHSVYTLDFAEQRGIIEILRQQYPDALHIAGGPHANFFPDECMMIFDSVIFGEGDDTIVEAVRDLKAGKLKRIYRPNGIVDINVYSCDRRHFLPKSATARKNVLTLRNKSGLENLWGTTAMFSRGCPYRCSFCAIEYARREAPGIRFRKPEYVEAEIEYLKKDYGIQGLSLTDEIVFPLNPKAAMRHLEAIGRTNILWRGQCRVDGVTPEIASLARQSGCVALGMGVESVAQRCLDIINKQVSVQKARETIAMLKANDIEARMYLIIGLPGEPDDIVEQTWSFIRETQPDLVYLGLFTVRPGTEMFNNPEKFGIASVSYDWENTMHRRRGNQENKKQLSFKYAPVTPWGRGMSEEEIIRNHNEIYRRVKEAGLSSFELYKDSNITDD